MSDKIEIAISKQKALYALLGSAFFVIFGFLGAVKPENFVSTLFRNPEVIRIVGIIGVCFFGAAFCFIVKKMLSSKFGLIVDGNGITDNSNALEIGLIEWGDITRIEKIRVASFDVLVIHTNVPDKYIGRAKNIISKKTMLYNQKMFGSPLSISSNSLKIDFHDLEEVVLKEFKNNKHLTTFG